MLDLVLQYLSGLPHGLIAFIISMVPLIELRGGVIYAAAQGLPIYETLFLTIAGNILPIPFILLFIKHVFKFFRKHGILVNLIDKVTDRAMNQSHRVENLEFIGLILFVGIPLPGTGAWTGALIASLLNIKFSKAITAIFLGVVLAALIMSLGAYGLINILF